MHMHVLTMVLVFLMTTLIHLASGINSNIAFTTITNHNLPIAWSGGISYVYNDTLCLLGGGDDSSGGWVLNKMYALDLSLAFTNSQSEILLSSSSWKEHTVQYPSLTNIDYSSVGIKMWSQQWTINDDKIYILSPVEGSVFNVNDMLIFDMKANVFLDATSYESELISPDVRSCCTSNNHTHVFAIGGRSSAGATDTTRIYHIETDRWSIGSTMGTARDYFACSPNALRTAIYIFGGVNYATGKNFYDSVEKYYPLENTWTDINTATLAAARSGLRCILDVINHNDIYCIGGYYMGNSMGVVDIFNIDSETMKSNLNGLPIPNFAFGIILYEHNNDGILFNIGGNRANGQYLNTIQYNSIVRTTTPLPTTVIAHPTYTSGPSQMPTNLPTSQLEYNMKYINTNVSCDNLGDHAGIRYDESISKCMDWCTNRDDCEMFNYFEDFKQLNDSRCYIFDTLCDITIDNERKSVIGYFEFDNECVNYPLNWRDNTGDDCNYYQTYNWCKNKTLLRTYNDFVDLIDSKYELTAIESCCECGGGIHIMDNVAFSIDSWIEVEHDILCTWEHSAFTPQSSLRNWNNFVLYDFCDALEGVNCNMLIDRQFNDNDYDYSMYLCDHTSMERTN
eukprot:935373_1